MCIVGTNNLYHCIDDISVLFFSPNYSGLFCDKNAVSELGENCRESFKILICGIVSLQF